MRVLKRDRIPKLYIFVSVDITNVESLKPWNMGSTSESESVENQ